MKNRIYAKPAFGRRFPLPDGKIVPEDGQYFDNNRFVRRRLTCGDLIECDPPAGIEPAADTDSDITTEPVPEQTDQSGTDLTESNPPAGIIPVPDADPVTTTEAVSEITNQSGRKPKSRERN